ncbi:MAG: LysM peptidoglycan-binding domain-containing protein [Candidatus Acidiferrales bacterium]
MRPTRFAAPAILFLCCATFGAAVSRAQDQQDQSVAEAARQERARKQELQKRPAHVYTDNDLSRAHILTPEDRAVVEAKRNECARKNNCSPGPSQNPPASLDANSQTPQMPLGDVARQLRKQKELQALKPKQTQPFHLPVSTPALASPILPERPAIRPPSQPVLHSKSFSTRTPSNVFRRDPFSAVPVRPEIRQPEVRRPEIRSSVRENVSPEIRVDVHAAVREKIRTAVRPKVGSEIHPTVREDVLAIVQPRIHPDFSKEVLPTPRARRRLTAPALPKISPRPATPSILIPPMRPPALAEPVQPVAPVPSDQPTQSQPALASTAISNQKIVRVLPGDSLWRLAYENLGRGSRWPELLAANRWIANPNQIRAGAELHLPVAAATPVAARDAGSHVLGSRASNIKVRKGDTLWSLAKSTLGRSSYWPCLAAANPAISNPNRISADHELFVPRACSPKTYRRSSEPSLAPQPHAL